MKYKKIKYQEGGDIMNLLSGNVSGISPLSSVSGILGNIGLMTDKDKSNNGTGIGGAIGGGVDLAAGLFGIPTFGLGQTAGSLLGSILNKDKEPPKSFRPSGNTSGYYQLGGYIPTIDTSMFGANSYIDIDDVPIPIDVGYDILKKGGWIQKATSRMKKKGTVGSFTRYCGGKVTNDCIQRGLNSSNAKIRKKAQFAKAMRSINK